MAPNQRYSVLGQVPEEFAELSMGHHWSISLVLDAQSCWLHAFLTGFDTDRRLMRPTWKAGNPLPSLMNAELQPSDPESNQQCCALHTSCQCAANDDKSTMNCVVPMKNLDNGTTQENISYVVGNYVSNVFFIAFLTPQHDLLIPTLVIGSFHLGRKWDL